MVSDFRKKKYQYVFTFFDNNKSGTIDKKDFDIALEKIAEVKKWKVGEPAYNVLKDSLQKIWEGLQSADADKSGEVSLDEWVAAWSKYGDSPAEWQDLYAKIIFQLHDRSDDGAIDGEEFAQVYADYGVDKSEAKAAFDKFSLGKNSVNWEEFHKLFKEFFTTDDVNAPGNFIYAKTSF